MFGGTKLWEVKLITPSICAQQRISTYGTVDGVGLANRADSQVNRHVRRPDFMHTRHGRRDERVEVHLVEGVLGGEVDDGAGGLGGGGTDIFFVVSARIL